MTPDKEIHVLSVLVGLTYAVENLAKMQSAKAEADPTISLDSIRNGIAMAKRQLEKASGKSWAQLIDAQPNS